MSIATKENDRRPAHPRLTFLMVEKTWGEAVGEQVRDIVGDEPHGMVILGSRGRSRRMAAEFNTYSSFVSVGSYLVMEDTIVNGFPVWADFGPGPAEAVKGIVETRGDWASDVTMDKYKLTFNPGGFIKRMS
ncbi:MAG: CmcI family methyltransferase [Acidimicrobiia bacterium]|nr:CmcI family methyltransferase [Acidimicrobiia bacterium]